MAADNTRRRFASVPFNAPPLILAVQIVTRTHGKGASTALYDAAVPRLTEGRLRLFTFLPYGRILRHRISCYLCLVLIRRRSSLGSKLFSF